MGILENLGIRKVKRVASGTALKLYPIERTQGKPLVDATTSPAPQMVQRIEFPTAPEKVGDTGFVDKSPPADRSGIGSRIPASRDIDDVELPRGWHRVDESYWSVDLLQAMDWKLFEELCAEVFRRRGYEAQTTPIGPDGGIDIIAHKSVQGADESTAVQCKCYRRSVQLKEVREFWAAGKRAGHQKLVYIASSDFNERSRAEFSEDPILKLVDGPALLRVIEKLGVDAESELLRCVVKNTEGWQTQTCPECDVKMLCRDWTDGTLIWGCPNYGKKNCRNKFHIARGANGTR